MTNTGKAVITVAADVDDAADAAEAADATDGASDDAVLAAVAFNEDRTDPDTLWLRYVTVRDDRRGEGLGPRLCVFVLERAAERGYDTARIAVNNPFAYEALYRAGFAFTGRETGIAELVLERPTDAPAGRDPATYRDGLDRFRGRERTSAAEARFLADRPPDAAEPPALLAAAERGD